MSIDISDKADVEYAETAERRQGYRSGRNPSWGYRRIAYQFCRYCFLYRNFVTTSKAKSLSQFHHAAEPYPLELPGICPYQRHADCEMIDATGSDQQGLYADTELCPVSAAAWEIRPL